MIVFLSPSKSVTERPQPDFIEETNPLFPEKTSILVADLQSQTKTKLQKTLAVSASLAELNYNRFQSWSTTKKRAALWLYAGDVYNGVDAFTLTQDDVMFAQNNIRIISGLYGVVRPLDSIQPYRLEMRLSYSPKDSGDLYEYWSKQFSDYLHSSTPDT